MTTMYSYPDGDAVEVPDDEAECCGVEGLRREPPVTVKTELLRGGSVLTKLQWPGDSYEWTRIQPPATVQSSSIASNAFARPA